MWKAQRLEGSVRRGEPLRLTVDGTDVAAYTGETLATALLSSGTRAMRTARDGSLRGLFCGMGMCFDCLVTVNGRPNVRACVTPAAEGMTVTTRPA
jgi:predicted molibdopterin-dependent oxidoreductase YjgC